jgi:hypothetical protein
VKKVVEDNASQQSGSQRQSVRGYEKKYYRRQYEKKHCDYQGVTKRNVAGD